MIYWGFLIVTVLAFAAVLGLFFIFFSRISFLPADRGLKKLVFASKENSKALIFEPSKEYIKVVPLYSISSENGEISLVCNLNESVMCVDITVRLFNKRNHCFKTLRICQNIINSGRTAPVSLPKNTSYISLKVNSADNIAIKSEVKRSRLTVVHIIFAIFIPIFSLLEVFAIRFFIASIFGDVYVYDFMHSFAENLISAIIGTAIGLVAIACALKLFKEAARNVG